MPAKNLLSPRVLPGLVVAAAGIILLLNSFDIVNLGGLTRFWPVLLIALGAQMLIRPKGKDNSVGGIILLSLGAYFLARNFGMIDFGIQQLWPIAVIAAGVAMLRKAMARA